MSKFDFTSIMDRHGKDSMAVDVPDFFGPQGETLEGFDRIPMWVADMNFPTCPTITEEMHKRIDHPAFGYYVPTDEYYDSIIGWQKKRNSVKGLEKKHIAYDNGVLGGVVSALNVLCSRGDNVLLNSPTYIGFTGALTNNGYNIVLSPLKFGEDGIWRYDFEDMEQKIVENHIHAAIICSPHNPTGRVWTMEELNQLMALFEKHGVWVICDEIWSDLIMPGYRHIPLQSVSDYAREHCVAMYAPSKTFNLAGLVGSYHICYNDWLRERIDKESSLCHYNSMNVVWMHALIGAYKPEGHEWVDELVQVLEENAEHAVSVVRNRFEGVSCAKPQGTYMLFLDCRKWCEKHHCSIDELQERGVKYGVLWQDGRPFHGEYAIRMNLALPASRVKEAFHRLDHYVFNAD